MPQLPPFPLPFWLVLVALAFFAVMSWRQSESSIRVPMLVVLMTVGFWYIGDALYNDYIEYIMTIGEVSLRNAWWEVLLFICAFGILAPFVHRYFNRKYLGRRSNLLLLARYGAANAKTFQTQIDVICRILAVIWALIMFIALIRTNFDFQGLFMPYLGSKAQPWNRGRVGSGFDSLVSLAGYLLIGLTATFGILAAISSRPATSSIATIIYLLALPTYIFDRTRSVMLATILPGFLTLVFVRIRAGILVKAAVLIVGFMALEGWLKFVIENRSEANIAAAFHEGEFNSSKVEGGKHLGLNMFEELGYINAFIADGSYRPNWGARYFAEIVNPIPRTLWPGKPFIGIDYSIARGQAYDNADDNQAGVGASVSTGMIGQGVVNFGRILGPLAAALIMSLWVAVLARQDLLAAETGRLLLYTIGLILTFNMGRDITLLVMYPFFFGYLLLFISKSWQPADKGRVASTSAIGAANRASRTGAIILNGMQRQRKISSVLQKKIRRN